MSPPVSRVPDEAERVRDAVRRARAEPPHSADPALATVREADIGTPALVHAPGGEPEFWLVPLVRGEFACGFASVDLARHVTRLGAFGAGADDRAAWPQASFFRAPAEATLREVRARHPDASDPVLSYDRSPARWAWRLTAGGGRDVIYISSGGWYRSRATQA